nr:hypothetical protein Iba_chr15eCG1350 [Ipomoea batatas]
MLGAYLHHHSAQETVMVFACTAEYVIVIQNLSMKWEASFLLIEESNPSKFEFDKGLKKRHVKRKISSPFRLFHHIWDKDGPNRPNNSRSSPNNSRSSPNNSRNSPNGGGQRRVHGFHDRHHHSVAAFNAGDCHLTRRALLCRTMKNFVAPGSTNQRIHHAQGVFGSLRVEKNFVAPGSTKQSPGDSHHTRRALLCRMVNFLYTKKFIDQFTLTVSLVVIEGNSIHRTLIPMLSAASSFPSVQTPLHQVIVSANLVEIHQHRCSTHGSFYESSHGVVRHYIFSARKYQYQERHFLKLPAYLQYPSHYKGSALFLDQIEDVKEKSFATSLPTGILPPALIVHSKLNRACDRDGKFLQTSTIVQRW